MRLDEITPLGFYSVQGRKVKALHIGVPYGPAERHVGLRVQEADGRERVLACRDLDRAWTEEDEKRQAERRRRHG